MIFQAICVIRNDGEKSVVLSSGKAHRGVDNRLQYSRAWFRSPFSVGHGNAEKQNPAHESQDGAVSTAQARRNIKRARIFKHRDFSECLIFLGRNEKDQHL
jgi:hypothetical protein